MNGRVEIGAEQLRLIDRSSAYLAARKRSGRDIALDPECYLNSWAPCPGFQRLRRIAYGLRAEPARLRARARDAAGLLKLRAGRVAGTEVGGTFDSLVVSWALPSDIDADGNHHDRYLNVGSRDVPGTLWFLILLSGQPPARIAPNVRLFHRPAGLRPPRHALGRLSRAVSEAAEIAAAVEAASAGFAVSRIVMPYEAQPFQQAIHLAAKRRNRHAVTAGYVHSALPALPTDYLFRDGAPDELLVHGAGQAEILTRRLGWPEARVRVIDSLRYLRDATVPFAGHILLPYSFENVDFIVERVAAMLDAAPAGSMPRWLVRNHPVQMKSARHLALAARLETLIAARADRGSDDSRAVSQTLMIGATAAVIEALERGLDVVHVCVDSLFQRQSPEIWTHLEVETLAPDVYRYRLREPGAYIRLGARDATGERLGLRTRL